VEIEKNAKNKIFVIAPTSAEATQSSCKNVIRKNHFYWKSL